MVSNIGFFLQACQVQALYDFEEQEIGELSFKRGEIITVTDKSDDNWWEGYIGRRRGMFPATYVTEFHAG